MAAVTLLPMEIDPNDLRWMAQTVHHAYHEGGFWQDCERAVCEWAFKALTEHDQKLALMFNQPFERIHSRGGAL